MRRTTGLRFCRSLMKACWTSSSWKLSQQILPAIKRVAERCLFTKHVACGEISHFLCSVISQGKAVALDRWGGKWNHLSMTHRLTTNCAENYCNRTLIVKVIVENVVTFFGNTVYVRICICNTLSTWYKCTLAARRRGNNARSLLVLRAMWKQQRAMYYVFLLNLRLHSGTRWRDKWI